MTCYLLLERVWAGIEILWHFEGESFKPSILNTLDTTFCVYVNCMCVNKWTKPTKAYSHIFLGFSSNFFLIAYRFNVKNTQLKKKTKNAFSAIGQDKRTKERKVWTSLCVWILSEISHPYHLHVNFFSIYSIHLISWILFPLSLSQAEFIYFLLRRKFAILGNSSSGGKHNNNKVSEVEREGLWWWRDWVRKMRKKRNFRKPFPRVGKAACEK